MRKRRTTTAIVGLTALLFATVSIAAPSKSKRADAARDSKKKTAKKKTAKKAKKADNRPTVAVLYFDYRGKKDDEMAMLRKGLAQMVISDLSAVDRVRLVERERLQELLKEMKLSNTRSFDKRTSARIGKLLGARFMIIGGYFAMMGTLRIDAKVVEVETGTILRSFGVNGKQDDFIGLEQQLSTKLAAVLTEKLPALPPRVVRKYKRRKRAKPPKKLHAKQAVRYAKALDAKDRGDFKKARAELQKVVKERPDFQLAQLDLASMVQ